MIGLPTGRRSGLYVVDIDVRGESNGMTAYLALNVPRAAIAARTPSGGGHAYFRWPGEGWGNTVSRIAPGVDTRGEGGYVIAPPSARGEYRWAEPDMHRLLLDGRVPELPEELRVLLASKAGASSRPSVGGPAGRPPVDQWAATAMREEFARVAAAAPGQRNATLNSAAFSLGQIVAEGRLDQGEVERGLRSAAAAAGLPAEEVEATLRSGLEAGLKEPRGPKVLGPTGSPPEDGEYPKPDMSLLQPRTYAPPPFPGQLVFGKVWADWIAVVAGGTSAPADYVGITLLAAAGSLVGNARWVRPWESWTEPPVIWGMLIGDPSSGKSTALKAVLAPLRALDRPLREDAELAHKQWQQNRRALRAAAQGVGEACPEGCGGGENAP